MTMVKIKAERRIKGRLPRRRTPQVKPSRSFESMAPKQTVHASAVRRTGNKRTDKIKNFVTEQGPIADNFLMRAINSGLCPEAFSGFLSLKVDTYVYVWQFRYGKLVGCLVVPEAEASNFVEKFIDASKMIGIKLEE